MVIVNIDDFLGFYLLAGIHESAPAGHFVCGQSIWNCLHAGARLPGIDGNEAHDTHIQADDSRGPPAVSIVLVSHQINLAGQHGVIPGRRRSVRIRPRLLEGCLKRCQQFDLDIRQAFDAG